MPTTHVTRLIVAHYHPERGLTGEMRERLNERIDAPTEMAIDAKSFAAGIWAGVLLMLCCLRMRKRG